MKRILIIENDKDLMEEVYEILSNEGFEISLAFNGSEGVREAQNFYPDLVLCDIMMPEMDGFEVLQQLQGSVDGPITPFVFITALSDRQYFRQGMELGASDYLTKPFTREELLNAIHIRMQNSERIDRNVHQRVNALEKQLKARIDQFSGIDNGSSFPDVSHQGKTELIHEVMRVIETNQIITELRNSIWEELRTGCSQHEKDLFLKLEKRIASPNFFWDNLTIFQQEFNKRFPGLLVKIENQFEQLSRYDLIFIAATYLELETHQIAGLLSISSDSVRKSRYRIKKKLGLNQEDDFYNYVKSLCVVDSRLIKKAPG